MTIGVPMHAQAEDLMMPFTCTAEGKAIRVTPSGENSYRIIGRRAEQPFVACAKDAAACSTMMVHRFAIDCGGTTVAWADVAQAAAYYSGRLPADLPKGFAPVSTISGRFVLPALTRPGSHVSPAVAMQELSPDSVIEAHDESAGDRHGGHPGVWVTEVRADTLRGGGTSDAGRVAASLGGVFLMLFAATMFAAGRWRLPDVQLAASHALFAHINLGLAVAKEKLAAAGDGARALWQRISAFGRGAPASDELLNACLMLNARLIEAEFAVATLGANQLLRDVLSSEIDAIRTRISDLERQLARRSAEKSSAIVRTLLRELDRINRIAQSAAREGDETQPADAHDAMPQSLGDAYRMLGINADAAPAVAKKLVDALRMSWHPDHARDDVDRKRREARMKQINGAWDIIKAQRAAA